MDRSYKAGAALLRKLSISSFAANFQQGKKKSTHQKNYSCVIEYQARNVLESTGSKSLELRFYSVASFAYNDDLYSQIGYPIILSDLGDIFAMKSILQEKKLKPVVRSVIGGEVYAFTNAFEILCVFARESSEHILLSIPIVVLTDSWQLFDAMTKGKCSSEKLTIDLLSARESYKRSEIQAVGLVTDFNNPADFLTKLDGNDALSRNFRTLIDDKKLENWIHQYDFIKNKKHIRQGM